MHPHLDVIIEDLSFIYSDYQRSPLHAFLAFLSDPFCIKRISLSGLNIEGGAI